MKTITTSLLLTISIAAFGQIKSVSIDLRTDGDRMVELNSGIEMVIPQGWHADETPEAASFTLTQKNDGDAKITTFFYRYDNRKLLKQHLLDGLFISPKIKGTPVSDFGDRFGWISTEFDIEGRETLKGYAEGRCEGGYCVLNVLVAQADALETLKSSLYQFSDKTRYNRSMGMR